VNATRPHVSVLWSASANTPAEKLSKFMTTAAEASTLESRSATTTKWTTPTGSARKDARIRPRSADYHPAHWDVAAAEELGYSAGGTTDVHVDPGHGCNRRMFESVVVGYDTYLQPKSLRTASPIVAGDELHFDAELTSCAGCRQGSDHRDQHLHRHGRRAVHTCTPRSSASPRMTSIRGSRRPCRSDDARLNILGIGESDAAYRKTVRPPGEIRISDGGTTARQDAAFDDVKVGRRATGAPRPTVPRDLVNYAAWPRPNPFTGRDIAKLAGLLM